MACQDVQNDTSRMHVMGQRLRACRVNGIQPVGQDGPDDIDHLAVAAAVALELSAHAPYSNGHLALFERCAVAKSAGFARKYRQIMQQIIDRFTATECACVLSNDLPVLPAFHPIRVSAHLDRATDCASINRVPVVVEPDEAGTAWKPSKGPI